jgi:hypothetical protein
VWEPTIPNQMIVVLCAFWKQYPTHGSTIEAIEAFLETNILDSEAHSAPDAWI